MKTSFIPRHIMVHLHVNKTMKFSCEIHCTRTRFEREANGDSEMAHSLSFVFLFASLCLFVCLFVCYCSIPFLYIDGHFFFMSLSEGLTLEGTIKLCTIERKPLPTFLSDKHNPDRYIAQSKIKCYHN